MGKQSHWENVYQTKDAKQVSWFQQHLSESLKLILNTGVDKNNPVIDVGGGTSTLADDLLKEGFTDITVLDISFESLEVSKKRLGKNASKIHWIAVDVTTAELPEDHYSVWHDRAVFHFLTDVEDRQKYKQNLYRALKPKAFAVISTFSPKGPMKCSGLDVVRYSPETLTRELGRHFNLVRNTGEVHQTPFCTTQDFIYCLFQKI